MTKINIVGIDENASAEISKELNHLLSTYQVFYSNVRGFHWNIKGEKFFELHAKFEELYNDLLVKVDEIAERVLTLGETPVHTMKNYLEDSAITEANGVTDGVEAVSIIVNNFLKIIPIQRGILELTGDHGDEGTNSLMSDYISEQEKLVWMYNAFLSK